MPAYAAGETVVLELPMDARVRHPDIRVDDARGQVAVERGPLVLCLESVDLPDGLDTEDLVIDTATTPIATDRGARVALRRRVHGATTGYADVFEAELVPYHSWANRGPSTMRVWIPQT